MTSRAPLIAFGGSVGFTAVMATIGMGLGRQWVQIDALVWADTWLATFLFLLPCIAVTLTPAAIAVVVALRNAPAASRERRNWQIAAAGLAVSVVITLVYHLPTNIRIWTGDFTADEATTQLHRWLVLHAVRTLAGLVAVVAIASSAPKSAKRVVAPMRRSRSTTRVQRSPSTSSDAATGGCQWASPVTRSSSGVTRRLAISFWRCAEPLSC